MALDCFYAASYKSTSLDKGRVARAVEKFALEASGQNLARYLYRSEAFGITEPNLLLKLAMRIIEVE